MIDINKAIDTFERYVSNYNLNDSLIKIKHSHSLRVSTLCREIATSLRLDTEAVALAELMGLMHDIGRFEQIRIYNSADDLKTVDHGDLGAKILLDNNLIRDFIDTDVYDKLIIETVSIHNKASIPENYTEEEKLYAKIVRDADKIDILYLLSIKDIGIKIASEDISQEVIDCILSGKLIEYKIVKTSLDALVLDLALVYDLNYVYSNNLIMNGHYIDLIIDGLDLKEEKTKSFFQALKGLIDEDLKNYKGVN